MTIELKDGIGRKIDYLRLSVTDRCDFRCVYCMAEKMTFLPRVQVLSLEELYRLASLFVSQGVKKIRLTGGEPMVRPGIVDLCRDLSTLHGLEELVMTTNGSHLTRLARPLADAGVKRLNISLDSLDPGRFRAITRIGDLEQVLRGIETARHAGFQRIKLNCVVMKGRNADEILNLANFAFSNQLDISFIEEMPLGRVGNQRQERFCSSDEVRAQLASRYNLIDSAEQSGGPARYVRIAEYPRSRIGFISPHTYNFCANCNRLRVTVDGRMLLCLGHEKALDLKYLMRRYPESDHQVAEAIHTALAQKPLRHEFTSNNDPQELRFMNVSGG
ncbi:MULTISPECIES: GTP 3',8-cyclase MoaA [Pseudomonas]|uniref:GTP 3',8-cyclase n=1 Tax=Pseudomonas lutea TaxID=243924 RepID=A0A9X8QJV2_9PSED|nr:MULTISPECIES: GTP 3',8-cyclase MoaA [Pseudomonas]SEQ65538.1 cyclic pyranopterin phosphate synthase [Pseudomonas lutea]